MKILIGYDGSDYADAALEDLKYTGLPNSAEATVVSLADVILPPADDESEENAHWQMPAAVRRAHERAERKVKLAADMAQRASEVISKSFPGWQVRPLALADSPSWALIRIADELQTDLVVMGARGHSVLGGRLILGSVSQRVLYEASCSVRIARGPRNGIGNPLRLLVGSDNSAHSKAAVESICRREWPAGTEVRLLAVVDSVMPIAPDPAEPSLIKWIEAGDEENWGEVRQIFEPTVALLRESSLDAAVMIRRGDAAEEIIDEAESWSADSIFLGAKGTRGIDRLLLGSVSAAVSARAHCSVEVVRPRRG